MIADGLKLMVMGMGYVITFLAVMIIIMELAAKGLKPFAHLVEEKAAAPRKAPQKNAGQDKKNLIAAAIAAVHMHRNKK